MENKGSFTVDGLKVTKHVEQNEIDKFVSTLPDVKKGDMKDVLMALHEEGLITIEELSDKTVH